MISFDVKTTIMELLEADPQTLKNAEECLTMIKSYTCRPGFDAAKAELIIHVPVIFDDSACAYKAQIATEIKTQNTKKQSAQLMIYTDADTGERITRDPNVPKGQAKLF